MQATRTKESGAGLQSGQRNPTLSAVAQSSQQKRTLDSGVAKITYIQPDGTETAVEVENGMSVMEGAIRNMVRGIEAECGGACACATCHVYVDEKWREKVGGPNEMEEDMLDFAFEPQPNSRLSCQIEVEDALDGLVVRIPARQI